MINQDDVKHIAKLARLGIAEEEVGKFQKDLTAILDMVEKLKEVNVENVEPTSQVTGLNSVMRADENIKCKQEGREKLLANAPETKEGYIKVKAVFK